MKNNNIKEIQKSLKVFAQERDWDKFHSPKNLAMALSGEVGELTEIFQWLTPNESTNLTTAQKAKVEEELADVFLYLLRLADTTNIDIIEASHKKIIKNAEKYPIEKSFGNATKYTEL